MTRLKQPPGEREEVPDKLAFINGHGSDDRNSTASIFPQPFRFRLSTTPAADLVSALGFSSITYCLAYWRRVSILRSNSAVLLLRIGPTIISSFPVTAVSTRSILARHTPVPPSLKTKGHRWKKGTLPALKSLYPLFWSASYQPASHENKVRSPHSMLK
jgi:hypothetical protein